jgi:hypothetical protein
MENKQKYLYLLRFKDTPLIKIGEGTKDENSKYNRIQNHLRTYGHVFDLEESYEIIAPKSYSIAALERQLKDITMSYYPTEEVMKDYCGKDGATEIRTVESLAKILELIEFQKKFISLSLTKGITIIKPERPVKSQKENKLIKPRVEEETVNFPFEYSDQKHLIELFLAHYYVPNLDLITAWNYLDVRNDLTLTIDTNKAFADLIHVRGSINDRFKDKTRRTVWCNPVKSGVMIKRKVWCLSTGKSIESAGITSLNFNIILTEASEGEHCIITIRFLNNYIECSEDLGEWKNWFEKLFIKPLDTNIPNKRVEAIIDPCQDYE